MDSSAVFVSYRHGTDGDRLVSRVGALLRCSGFRAWIDHVDVGAGPIDQRIEDALERAEAGVLVVTADLVNSDYVKAKELPRMIRRVAEERLPMMVVNTYRDPLTGDVDIRKPDEIVESITDIPLVDITQADVESTQGQKTFVYGLLRRRAETWVENGTTHLSLHIQSEAGDAVALSDLELSFGQSSAGMPNDEYRQALSIGLPELARACKRAKISSLAVDGQARLAVALTLGAMFPDQAGIARLTVNDEWGDPAGHDSKTHGLESTPLPDYGGDSVAVFVKLTKAGAVPTGNDHAFTRLAEKVRPRHSVRIDLTGDGWIEPGEGQRLAREVGRIITQLTDEADVSRVHLCLMGPFPMAVLIGRQLNRLDTTIYEYLDGERNYLPQFRLRPNGSQPITALGHEQRTFDELRNLTPHVVTLLADDDAHIRSWPAADRWARLTELSDAQEVRVGDMAIPSRAITYGAPVDLPEQREGVGLIVPRVLAEKVRRADMLFPGDEVRDETGAIVGCRRLDSYQEEE